MNTWLNLNLLFTNKIKMIGITTIKANRLISRLKEVKGDEEDIVKINFCMAIADCNMVDK